MRRRCARSIDLRAAGREVAAAGFKALKTNVLIFAAPEMRSRSRDGTRSRSSCLEHGAGNASWPSSHSLKRSATVPGRTSNSRSI